MIEVTQTSGNNDTNNLKENKIKMSKKLMASIKKDIQVASPTQHHH